MRHNIKIYEEMNNDDPKRFYPKDFQTQISNLWALRRIIAFGESRFWQARVTKR